MLTANEISGLLAAAGDLDTLGGGRVNHGNVATQHRWSGLVLARAGGAAGGAASMDDVAWGLR